MSEQTPKRIGRYQIEEELGRGGSGVVYRCVDGVIGRVVAIKVLAAHGTESQQRFLLEMQATGRLNHPNVAAIFDAGRTDDGEIYVVQEFVDGVNLRRVIAKHPKGIDPTQVVGLLLQLAQALAHAHERGIVHRDVKPGNVSLMGNGQVKLLDFGIARFVNEVSETTVPGTVVGTPQYVAPEQLMGHEITHSVDIYSLGVLGYELLSGRKPFTGDFAALVYQVMNGQAPALSSMAPGAAPALTALIEACMAKLPVDRPRSMTAIAVALEELTRSTDIAWVSRLVDDKRQSDSVATFDVATMSEHTPPDMLAQPSTTQIWPVLTPPVKTVAPTPIRGGFDALEGSNAITFAPPLRPDWRDLTSKKVGRFVLHELIAHGRSGDLYKAWDPARGELVAVKVVHANDAEARERLLRGGRIWLKLHHPHIVRVYEVHPDFDGLPGVIVSEFVEGNNLDALVAQRHLGLDEAVWIVMQVCDALRVIHALGVVHREVKPRNILVSGDALRVTLLDSGIARHTNPEIDAFTKIGVRVGDLAYAAPEMAAGRSDQRSDVYAVVAVLYELVTKTKLPFPMAPDWQADADLLNDLPQRLRLVLERGLRTDPAARFASMGELHDQLRPLAPQQQRSDQLLAVVALHGIRTQAAWQRAFSEVAGRNGMNAHVDRWNFGYFSVFRFLLPWARLAKVRWFRATYQQEFREGAGASMGANGSAGRRPCIVAHSFGTYILGNALLRYPYLRFDKVLLCGSILPRAFPWDQLIERGQVQAVRNEYGSHDVWTRAVAWAVPGTGPSGLLGFTASNARIEQERFAFEHSEYFERGHMDNRWLPFLGAEIEQRPAREKDVSAPADENRPWLLYLLYLFFLALIAFAVTFYKNMP